MSRGPVVVVGGSLAGLAAAARLAKAGHQVVLIEGRSRLGGRWAPIDTPTGRLETLPPAFTFPAPWRDLFKKSGRAFDAELTRAGVALVPAPAATHVFSDGHELNLPAERGAQWTTLADAYGPAVAARWRDLMDSLDRQWQLLRGLGVESEAPPGGLTWATRRRLNTGRTISDLAASLDHPHLGAVVSSVAWRIGSDPRRTPGWQAFRLSLERTFGRWHLVRGAVPVPASELVDLLVERLRTRGVEVRLNEQVTAIGPYRVHLSRTKLAASAVVCATNPWTYVNLAGGEDRALRRALRRATPARAPALSATPVGSVDGEVIHHTAGGPIVDAGAVRHDFTSGVPDPSLGPAWNSWRTWRKLAPLRAATPMTFLASGGSRGGNDPWACLLTGAQATYAVHRALTGQDIRPTNKALGRR